MKLAKQRELTYASFGKGSMAHLNIEALARKLGVKMVHVPYRGARRRPSPRSRRAKSP